ncbi:MAG: 5-(carboxyamino)imidazole ribonucleotide mutase [Gemmatimonadales bacterium]
MTSKPLVGIVMGSASDWPVMLHAANRLAHFGVACESRVISAHRSPALAHEYATTAEQRGLKCIIAAAGMAAHLAGVMAAITTIPVLGVPMPGGHLQGMDALLATVQMPAGIPVATFAIGDAGAHNAALFAVAMLAVSDKTLAAKLKEFRAEQEDQED